MDILAAFVFYGGLSALALLAYWGIAVRFGDTADLDPDSWLVRAFRRRKAKPAVSKLSDVESPQESLQDGLHLREESKPDIDAIVRRHAEVVAHAIADIKLTEARFAEREWVYPKSLLRASEWNAVITTLREAFRKQGRPRASRTKEIIEKISEESGQGSRWIN
jgi:hypothetical protein